MVLFVIVASNYIEGLRLAPESFSENLDIARFVYSPNCFALKDVMTERVYPLHIDLAKFTDQRLEECYNNTEKKYRLTLEYDGKVKTIQNKNFIESKNTRIKKVYVDNKLALLKINIKDLK